MTPLAHAIVKQLTLLKRLRTINDYGSLLPKMSDIHCFECSEIVAAADDIVGIDLSRLQDIRRVFSLIENVAFLPAPKTWIEFKEEDHRLGFLLVESKDKNQARVYHALCQTKRNNPITLSGFITMPLGLDASQPMASAVCGIEKLPGSLFPNGIPVGPHEDLQAAWVRRLYGMLAFINTPRIIGRRQYMPHKGLERDLLRIMPAIGKFPLHAWTEIKLDISPPWDMTNDPSVEAHLTGQRALHFCRAHLRIRLGKLEIVRSHWRGDAALGIKQSRYAVIDRSRAPAE